MEEKIPRCRLDPNFDNVEDLNDGPTFTTMELAAALSKSVNAGTGIGKSDRVDTKQLEKTMKTAKRKDEAEVDGDASSDEEESDEDDNGMNGNGNIPEVDQDSDSHSDDPFDLDIVTKAPKRAKVTFQDKLPKPDSPEDRDNRMLQIKNHLLLLAADSCRFLRRCGSRGLGEWTVDFEGLVQHLQETELDAMLLENFGKAGHRLARMMRKMGKLEEKQLPNLALLKQKDIRTKLAEMQMAGVVDIQEVPRDAGRTTNRTIFLWYFDTERVSAILLDSIYKMMSRCIQRLDVEKRRKHDVLSCTERSDVRDEDPETYLDAGQLAEFREIESKEESLLSHIMKLDDLVGLFRDF
jgi:DNA-directed RNA polymerase III subunit RPC3